METPLLWLLNVSSVYQSNTELFCHLAHILYMHKHMCTGSAENRTADAHEWIVHLRLRLILLAILTLL